MLTDAKTQSGTSERFTSKFKVINSTDTDTDTDTDADTKTDNYNDNDNDNDNDNNLTIKHCDRTKVQTITVITSKKVLQNF